MYYISNSNLLIVIEGSKAFR